MDEQTRQHLNTINQKFYAITATEFDQTRGTPWPGWAQLLPYLPDQPLNVLDVGCGNGRFGVYLAENHPHPITYTGVDSSDSLLAFARTALDATPNITATIEQRDVIFSPPDSGTYDLIGVFGLIHHVPGYIQRQDFVKKLAARLAPGGILALACWRFYDYERFQKRITSWPIDLADKVEQHDYLLDWRRGEVALRYCHHVDDAEHAALMQASGLTEVATYRADGFSGAVNLYSLLSNQNVISL